LLDIIGNNLALCCWGGLEKLDEINKQRMFKHELTMSVIGDSQWCSAKKSRRTFYQTEEMIGFN